MLEIIKSIINYSEQYAGRVFVAAAVICLLEYLSPQSRHSFKSRLRSILFWIVYIVITATGLILFYRLWGVLGWKPLFHIDLTSLSGSQNPALKIIGGILSTYIVLQVGEFFYYWFHRLQHTSRFFWRFHAVHHSLEEMNAFNSNHHFTEELFRIPFVTIPISLLFSFEQGYVPFLFAFLLGWQSIYEHSVTKLHFGIFRYVIPDNRFHRIHHSVEKKHYNKNFGSGSALWDIIFGTVYYPQKNEWPDTGLKGQPEPKSVKEFILMPFKSKRKKTSSK